MITIQVKLCEVLDVLLNYTNQLAIVAEKVSILLFIRKQSYHRDKHVVTLW